MTKQAIETAMEAAPTSTASTTPTATAAPAPEAPDTTLASATIMESGGEVKTDKLQWLAIGIFSLTLIALVYKGMYYRKAISLLGKDNEKTDKKLKELEQNLRTLRGAKYETMA